MCLSKSQNHENQKRFFVELFQSPAHFTWRATVLQDQMVLAGVAGWKDFERYHQVHTIIRHIEDTPRFAGYLKTRPPAAF